MTFMIESMVFGSFWKEFHIGIITAIKKPASGSQLLRLTFEVGSYLTNITDTFPADVSYTPFLLLFCFLMQFCSHSLSFFIRPDT